MVTITGVAEGMATITVTASDPDRRLYAMQTIMVTVMMMPPMELGAPSITSVMSDADRHGHGHADARRQRRPALDLGTAH